MDATFWLVSVLALFWIIQLVSLQVRGSDRSRLERKVDLILKHLGLDSTHGLDPQIRELMKADQKIQAIKLYREHTGAGLKESKEYVESLARNP